jgi:hypothetical protein
MLQSTIHLGAGGTSELSPFYRSLDSPGSSGGYSLREQATNNRVASLSKQGVDTKRAVAVTGARAGTPNAAGTPGSSVGTPGNSSRNSSTGSNSSSSSTDGRAGSPAPGSSGTPKRSGSATSRTPRGSEPPDSAGGPRKHVDVSAWDLPLVFRKTEEQQQEQSEQRLLNKGSYLRSLFLGIMAIALAGVTRVVLASGDHVCCFELNRIIGNGTRNISVPTYFFNESVQLELSSNSNSNSSSSPFAGFKPRNDSYSVLVTYFTALALMLAVWIAYAIAVWRRVFKSWMRQQRFYVVAAFQWTAVVISFSEVVLARPGFFAGQYFMLLACIFKFGRTGLRWSIFSATGAVLWYFLSAMLSMFGLSATGTYPPVDGSSDADKLAFCGLGAGLALVLTLPAYNHKQLNMDDFAVVNDWLDRLVALKASMSLRVQLINTVFPRSVGLRLANQAVTYAKAHDSSSIMFFKVCGLEADGALTQQDADRHLCNIVCLFDDLSVSLGAFRQSIRLRFCLALLGLAGPV